MAVGGGVDTIGAMRFLLTASAILLMVGSPAALGQSRAPGRPLPDAAQRPGDPVDQTVGDLGPHITSFRQVEPGLGDFSARLDLYRRRGPARWQARGQSSRRKASGELGITQPFVYEAPGVRAFVDRPQYRTRQGENVPARGPVGNPSDRFKQHVGANTVYDLIPRDHPQSPLNPGGRNAASGKVELNGVGEQYRIDGRFTTRIAERVAGEAAASAESARPRRQDINAARHRAQQHGADEGGGRERAATQPSDMARFGPNHPINQDKDDQRE